MTRLWWFALAMIVVAGLAIYWAGYNSGFEVNDPLANNIDEIWIYQESFELTRIPPDQRRLAGYPPGLLWLDQLAHLLTGNFDRPNPIETLNLVRLWSGVANGGTLIVIALTGRHLYSPVAGLVAATAWLMAPLIVLRVRYALTEPYQTLFVSLAMYFALRALTDKSSWSAVISVLAGLGAVLFKYSAFPTLGLGTGAAFWLLIQDWRSNRRKWGAALIIQLVAIVLCAIWLVQGHDALNLIDRPEVASFADSSLSKLRLDDYLRASSAIIEQVGWDLLPFAITFAVGTLLFIGCKSSQGRCFWLLAVGFVGVYLALMLLYIIYWLGAHRYTTPTTPVVVLVLTTSLLLIGAWLLERLHVRHNLLRVGGLTLLVSLWIVPMSHQTILDAQQRSVPRIEMPFMNWLGDALPAGTIILPQNSNLWWLTDQWWGYDGPQRPWIQEPLDSRTSDVWQSMHVNYAYLADWRRNQMRATLEGATYLDNLLLLKHFPRQGDLQRWRGDPFSIYYLGPVEVHAEVVFGDQIALHGYTTSTWRASPGDSLTLQPFWQASLVPQADYAVFLHLTPPDSPEIMAQVDLSPGQPDYPPTRWTDPHEVIIGQPLTLTLPTEIEAGTYHLRLGLYDPITFERLTTIDGADFFLVSEITLG